MKARLGICAAAGVLAMTVLAGCSSSLNEDAVVLTVGDSELTADVANFYARYTQAQYETYYAGYLGEDMWNSEAEEGVTYEESVKDGIMEQLEIMLVLEDHMADYDIALTDAEKEVIKEQAKKFDEANSLENKEKVSGSSETVERVMTLMTIQEKMMNAIRSGADTEVSDEEAAQKSMQYVFYSYTASEEETGSDTEETEETDTVDKDSIKAQAEEFAQGAASASDFEAYAEKQGVEVSTATFDSESTNPEAAVVEAADQMEEGEVSEVIETESGCYVVKLTSLLDRDATDAEKETIIEQRKSDLYTETCEGWLDEADIDVNESVWKKVDFNQISVIIKNDESEDYADEVQTDDVAEAQEEAE